MPHSKTIIDRDVLNHLIRRRGGRKRVFKELMSELETIGALDRLPRKGYSDQTINRLLFGSNSQAHEPEKFHPFYLIESVFLSKILGVTLAELINNAHPDNISGTGIDTYAAFRDFGIDGDGEGPEERLVNYFTRMEEGERIVICQEFPSSIYVHSHASSIRRYSRLTESNSSNTEYYPMRALLNFLFSPVGTFSIEEKLEILDKMQRVFTDMHRHVFFFDHKQEGFPGNFASMNIVNRHDLLIVLISVPHMVLEIRNKHLLRHILQYFRRQDNKSLLDTITSKKLIDLAKHTISCDGGSDPDRFLEHCRQHGIHGQDLLLISDQFPQHRR